MSDLFKADIRKHPLLTADQEQELGATIRRGFEAQKMLEALPRGTHNVELETAVREKDKAVGQFMQSNLRLVVSLARKYKGQGVEIPDLIQEGALGLKKAAEKFDETRGTKFSTYATFWVRQAITKAIAEQGSPSRQPLHHYNIRKRLHHLAARWISEKGTSPTDDELTKAYNDEHLPTNGTPPLTKKRAAYIMKNGEASASLNKIVDENGDSGSEFADFVEDDTVDLEEGTIRQRIQEEVRRSFGALTPREQRILELRFGLRDGVTYTLKEVGELFGLTRERVRQIEQIAIAKLSQRNYLTHLLDDME